MKTMNYSLIRILFALVIGLVLVIWPNAAASYIVITVGVAFLSLRRRLNTYSTTKGCTNAFPFA